MVNLRFQDILNKESIESIREDHNFRESLPLEKFIMDFEVLTHIQEVLPDCVVKGGMAVPFHLSDKKLRRLSVDIDIVTARSREEVIEAMKQVSAKLKGVVDIGEPHIPKGDKKKDLPLLTYYCDYSSSVADNPEMKIEIFYGNDMQVQSKNIQNEIEIIGFNVNFPLSIYDHGSLIGDKLTTLPFNTIGLDSNHKPDIPKQIYDIATLLKSISGDIPLDIIVDTFEKISQDEISYFVSEPPTYAEILADLDAFSDPILINETQIKLNASYQGRFDTFTRELLGDNRYLGYAHVTDILLIKTIIKLILKKYQDVDMKILTQKATEIVVGINKLSNLGEREKVTEAKKLVAKYGKKSEVGNIMKDLFPEQVFLYDQLLEIEKL